VPAATPAVPGAAPAVPGERRTQLDELFNLTVAARGDLERKLAEATAALRAAEQRHRAAMAEAEQRLAERQAKYEATAAQAAATWDMVDEQLRTAAMEVEHARQNHTSAAAEVERLSRRESELVSQLAEATTTRSGLERRLAAAETAVEAANARTEQERGAAIERLAEREREFEAQIAQEVDERRSIEELLAQAVSAQEEADKQHAAAMTDAAVQSRELEAALRLSRMDVESKNADIERLTQRETDLSSTLADVTTSRDDLERRLAVTEAAFDDTTTRATRERLAASKKAAERQAELERQIRQERATRATLEQTVANAEAALRDAQQQHEAALGSAAAELAARQTEFDRELAQTTSDRDRLAERLSEASSTLDQVRSDYQTTAAEVDRLTQREAELTSQLADIESARDTLGRELDHARSAIADAAEHADRERSAAVGRHQALEARLAEEFATRTTLEQAIADADTALREGQLQHEAALASAASALAERKASFDQLRRDHQTAVADVERLTLREAELTSQLADIQAVRDTLQHQLAEAESATADAAERAARERAAAARRQEDLDARLAQELATRSMLEQAIADADAALREAQQLHETALASAATELAERQSHFDRELAQTAADRDRLTERLSEAESALDQVRGDFQTTAAEVERLTQREAELTSQIADIRAARDTLERQLVDARSAMADAAERADRERAAALERHEDLETRLAQESATRGALEQTLTETRSAALDSERSLREEAASLRTQGLEREAHFETQLAQERLEHDSRLAAMQECTRKLSLEREALQQSLETIEEQLQMLALEHRAACDQHERARATADADIQRITAELRDTERALEEARTEFQGTLDHLSTEHGLALADLTGSLNERDAQLQEQEMRNAASLQAAERARTEEQAEFAATLADRHREIEQLQQSLATSAQEIEATKQRMDVLQTDADQVPQLHKQLDESRAESHRLFEHAGLAMFRCTREGTLIHANRACTTLLGRRTLDELRAVSFATAAFESPNVLSWLIERCSSTRAKESIETTWRRTDGGRLFVRLSGRLLNSDAIEVVVEDLTRLRVLQERLSQAHRLEAVGRFASEIAVTCSNLLSDIYDKSRQWLMTVSSEPDSRKQGQVLLDEVSRAAGFLHQLAEFGDEQARTPMLVDLNTLIRDLEPVLKRVAGGDVEVQVWDTSSPLNVDVRVERVERLLVNLASYGRGRMPFGGRLKIELGTIVVDRHFAAKHPSVRLGLHALITVTEIRSAARADGASPLRSGTTGNSSNVKAGSKPGVDFATLQGLVSECGGHLWMKVQPLGELVAKIRLPLVSTHEQAVPRTVATRSGRERLTTRLFQS
jgi:chromosome segregation ATPase